MNTSPKSQCNGVLFGLAAYSVWGILPLFFNVLAPFVTAFELLAHRLLWGLLFLGITLSVTSRWKEALDVLRQPRTFRLLILSAILIGINWFAFLYGVSTGQVVETSLGYFLCPLVSILLGLIVFRERLRPAATVAVILSAFGIAYLVYSLGTLPWTAIAIAVSFGVYGTVRKSARVDGLIGLFVETLVLTPPALVFLIWQAAAEQGAIRSGMISVAFLLVFSGVLTAIPMVFYGEAARRLKVSSLGFLQYLLPTTQLVEAVAVMKEPFLPTHQIAFALIWTALALVILDTVIAQFQLTSKSAGEPRLSIEMVRTEWKDRLPAFIQPFLTWIIGYPYRGQRPLLRNKPWWLMILIPSAILLSGMALSIIAVQQGGFMLMILPLSWLMQLNGSRNLQVHICHQGIHENLSGNATKDRRFVEVISAIIVVQDHDGYRDDHTGIHHPRLASDHDPDRRFTTDVVKIKPRLTKDENKKRFWLALISPKVHLMFLVARIKASFVQCSVMRRLLSIFWFVAVIGITTASEKWRALAIGVLLPMTIFYHMSAMCQFVTEHLWARKRYVGQSAKSHQTALLINRHLGDRLPDRDVSNFNLWLSWARWWLRLLMYHLPVRAGILVADLPVHGSHHLWPRDKEWTNSIYRYRELSECTGKVPTEFVGSFGQLLDYIMESFANPDDRPLPTCDVDRSEFRCIDETRRIQS